MPNPAGIEAAKFLRRLREELKHPKNTLFAALTKLNIQNLVYKTKKLHCFERKE